MIAKKCIHIAFLPLPFLLLFIFLSFVYHIFIPFTVFFLFIQLFFLYFFRDIPRSIGSGIVSPADGKIIYAGGHKIAIFMSLFDMHVNLMPYDGKIVKICHYKGEHKPAYGDVSKNERMEMEIDSSIGRIKLFQIAGIFARRIVPYVKEGQFVKKGDKIGIIRFGSRVELYLPESCEIIVRNGQKIKAGQTVAKI